MASDVVNLPLLCENVRDLESPLPRSLDRLTSFLSAVCRKQEDKHYLRSPRCVNGKNGLPHQSMVSNNLLLHDIQVFSMSLITAILTNSTSARSEVHSCSSAWGKKACILHVPQSVPNTLRLCFPALYYCTENCASVHLCLQDHEAGYTLVRRMLDEVGEWNV